MGKFNLSNYDFENSGWYKEDNTFGDEVFLSTVYFMDPKKICKTTGRNGTDDIRKLLWLDRSDGYVRVPPTRNLAEANDCWIRHFCHPDIGIYYLNMPYYQDTDCRDLTPYQLIFAGNNLVGFVFQHVAPLEG